MINFVKKNLPIISFLIIPLVFLYSPTWLDFFGSKPYWPLYWLLPWSMMHGPFSGLIVSLFLGLILDSISPDHIFTQIPGLVLCGLWFGRCKTCSNYLIGHFRYGLICSIGSFLCGSIYFLQILIKNLPDQNFIFYYPSIKNILAQVFVTGLFAPLFCSTLFKLFSTNKGRKSLLVSQRIRNF